VFVQVLTYTNLLRNIERRLTLYSVEATVNDVGGSVVLIGKFETLQEALETLLNLNPWDFTPELTEMWIRTPDGKILTGPWRPVTEADNLESETR